MKRSLWFVLLLGCGIGSGLRADPCVDRIQFGNEASEQAHRLRSNSSGVESGGLGETMRRLLPLAPPQWRGGTCDFTVKVDPEKPNYFTVRLWGSDVTANRLILVCEGKQVGYFHLGDIDILDQGSPEPAYNGRFFYVTSPLPPSLTRGKSAVNCEIRSIGAIWGYGTTWEQYQKTMAEPTRGLYQAYVSTDGYFVPPDDEKQGEAPPGPPVRQDAGKEALVFDALRKRIDGQIGSLLASKKPLNQMQLQFLAQAYREKWTTAFHNADVVPAVANGLDALYRAYVADPALAEKDPATPNPGWFGFGPAGDAIRLLSGPLQPLLDAPLDGKTRRQAWGDMLAAASDYHRHHRRQYTNQTMIVDMSLYQENRALALLDPARAMPEGRARSYLYQAVGLDPWLGSDGDAGPLKEIGDDYYQVTRKGLTRELGYVGYYGEVLDWVTAIYNATRDGDGPGDARIREQLIKLVKARAVFRYPMLDPDGCRAMRIEAVVGWRDEGHYPGDIAYAERTTWDGSALYAAAATLDPDIVGYAQQMFADNQYFPLVAKRMEDKSFRVTQGLLATPGEYDLVRAQPASPRRLPMTPGEPDFAWADEEDGVVAAKHGDEILYASLYWRARNAVNFLARVHLTAPRFDRIATVGEEAEFEPSGLSYVRPDWTNMGFGNGGFKYPDWVASAHAGETLPIARIPEGMPFKPGQESVYAGRASFYALRYGSYLIEMNASRDKPHPLSVPGGLPPQAVDLVTGKAVNLSAPGTIPPLTTLVLYIGE